MNKVIKTKTIKINFVIDGDFFAIMPSININFHSKELEFEWFIFGMYIKL